jgi:hypothetical protein
MLYSPHQKKKKKKSLFQKQPHLTGMTYLYKWMQMQLDLTKFKFIQVYVSEIGVAVFHYTCVLSTYTQHN